MSVPTRYNPKRLRDYTLRGGKTRPSRGILSSGPTGAERSKMAREKHKALIVSGIAESDQRRKRLEAMWKAENDKVTTDRKGAIDEYNSIMDSAPDFEDDTEGTLRANWENQPHVQAAKDRMRAHIESSMAGSKERMDIRIDPQADEMARAQHGTKAKRLAPKYREGFDSKAPPKSKEGDPVKDTVVNVEGSKLTVTGNVIRDAQGREFLEAIDEKGNRVGISREQLAKSKGKKKDPEVEPTGEEYGGSEWLTRFGKGIGGVFKKSANDPKSAGDF